jgi:hypothetical protein
VTAGARVYVVWATELQTGSPTRNLGALRVEDNLNGKLETLTPLRNFDVLITAEPQATVDVPGAPVLRVRVTPTS